MELEDEETSSPHQQPVDKGSNGGTSGGTNGLIISEAMNMNPTRRSNMEDAHSICQPGSWNESINHTTFLGLYDGHGGKCCCSAATAAPCFFFTRR
jgi:hypothetical protein